MQSKWLARFWSVSNSPFVEAWAAVELRQALAHVSEIREQLARTQVFRGYRSLTVAFSGLVGLAAAVSQSVWLPKPTENLAGYLALWFGAAMINLVVVGAEIWWRARMAKLSLTRRTTVFAVEQFLPSLLVGGLFTAVIFQSARDLAWMLPGLWAMFFSLGILASCRLLPRAVSLAGMWYLVAGVLGLLWGRGDAALSPWIMGITFGVGQLLTAAILYVTLERSDGEAE
jgi:hypothetical protein